VYLVWLQSENIRDPYVTELIIESDSVAHSLEDEDVSLQNDTGAGDISTGCTQWTDSTYCQPTVPVVHRVAGFPGGMTEVPHIAEDSTPFPCTSFLKS
jgi:hypothetical protein